MKDALESALRANADYIKKMGNTESFIIDIDGELLDITINKKKQGNPKDERTILAPMPGNITSYAKQVGDNVKTGEVVVVLEAMKMYNNLYAPCDGVIVATPFCPSDNVRKNDVMARIQILRS